MPTDWWSGRDRMQDRSSSQLVRDLFVRVTESAKGNRLTLGNGQTRGAFVREAKERRVPLGNKHRARRSFRCVEPVELVGCAVACRRDTSCARVLTIGCLSINSACGAQRPMIENANFDALSQRASAQAW
jgi:hypothetical protein